MIQGFDIRVLAKLQTIYDLITSSPPGSTTWGSITGTLSSQTDLQNALNAKQDTLVSGINIKTINTNSLLGSGDLSIHDLPTGGTEGQILAKNSATNYDTTWIDNYTSTVQHTVKLAESINKGQAVYVSSANGTNIIVSKADNSIEATSSKTMGLLAFSGAAKATGFVVTEGLLAGLDTSAANAAGDPVWLGTSGNLIYGLVNKPVAPAHLVFIGIVTRKQSNNGEIFIKVQNGFELRELHDVDAVSPSNNDGIFYNSTNSLWEHKSIATVLGYTPQEQISLTTTGTSGAATLVGSTLNIPQYASVGSGACMMYSNVQTATNITAGSTVYGGFINGAYQSLANEYLRLIVMPKNAVVSNFTVYALAQPASGSAVYTVRKNGVDTALVITIPAGSAGAFHTNTTTSVSFNALDYISVKAVNNASASMQPVSLSIICTI